MKYYIRIKTYVGGKLVDCFDCCDSYPTRKDAVSAARYDAAYWNGLTRGKKELINNTNGASRWFVGFDGVDYRRDYVVIKGQ